MWSKLLELSLGKWIGIKLQKELETYKVELQKKTYVSRVRFDTEFKIYSEIAESWAKIYSAIIMLTEESMHNKQVLKVVDKREKDYFGAETIALLEEQFTKIFACAPFIKEEMYTNSYELYRRFRSVANVATGINKNSNEASVKKTSSVELYDLLSELYKEADEKYHETIKEIREYLNSLEVNN